MCVHPFVASKNITSRFGWSVSGTILGISMIIGGLDVPFLCCFSKRNLIKGNFLEIGAYGRLALQFFLAKFIHFIFKLYYAKKLYFVALV